MIVTTCINITVVQVQCLGDTFVWHVGITYR